MRPGDAVVGRALRDAGLPQESLVMLIVRGSRGVPPRGSTVVEAGDRLYILARDGSQTGIEELLERWEHGPLPEVEPAADGV